MSEAASFINAHNEERGGIIPYQVSMHIMQKEEADRFFSFAAWRNFSVDLPEKLPIYRKSD